MAKVTAATLAGQPDFDKLVVLDWELARKLEEETWSLEVTETYAYNLSFTDGEVHRVVVNGGEYAEVFSAALCDATASSFYVSLTNAKLYIHMADGDDPSTGAPTYKYCIMAYFFVGITNSAVSLRRHRETLLDGKLDLWTSSSTLTRWTKGTTGTAALAREATEVYDVYSAYSAKMTVGAAASNIYIYQDITLRPGKAAMIRLKYKCAGTTAPTLRFYDTGANQYLLSNGSWQGSPGGITLTNSTSWTEYSITFTAHASYSSYRLLLLAQTNGDECYFDNVECKRFYEAAPFLPYLGESALPSISHSVGTFVNPDDQLSFGAVTFVDDGFFAYNYSRYQWHNKLVYVKLGVKTSTYDELAQMFLGLSRTPELADGRFSIDIQDARAEFMNLLQETFTAATYANCEDSWKEKPIPILLGHIHDITPPCSNTTGFDTFKITQTAFPSANYALNNTDAVYVGPRTNARIEGVWWSENLATGTFTLLRSREGQWVKCDATGYFTDWVDWLWFALTEINGTSPDMINYRSLLDLKAVRGGLTLARWYGDQANIRDALNQLKRSAQFFFFTRRTGEFYARALVSSVPSDTQRFYNEDLTGFSVIQETSNTYFSISVRYRNQSTPDSEKYAVVEESRADYEYGAKESIVIDMMETTDADAANMAGYYADILKKPLETIRVTLPAQALFLDPTDKIYISKSIVDNDGTTRTLYSDQVFVIMAIDKDLNSCKATVTAIKSDTAFYWTEAP